MTNEERKMQLLKRILKLAPWVIALALLFTGTLVFAEHPDITDFTDITDITDITPEELVEYAPKNDFLAAIFLIVLFAVKSLIFLIPIPVLYIASGFLFDPVTAFIVNVLGMIVCTAVPYWIGKYSGAKVINKLIKKYPKMQVIDEFKSENEWFLSFFVRAIGFLPCDAVSMILGAWRVDFKKYITGTAVGMLPGLIATTLVGITITNPRSPGFILSLILTVLVTLGSLAFYRIYLKLRK
jgi:uncharacterized membrane protein YdjX (TVP38/TMEM64 family)